MRRKDPVDDDGDAVVADSNNGEKDEETGRETWSNQCDFFFTSLGLAVGLGNVWRFPYVCYINGGGTFLIPYVTLLIMVGIPGLFLEQALGQYARAGVNKVYGRLVPIFKGFGYSVVTILAFSEMYYAVICGWAFYYLFAGFASELPWNDCNDGQKWHTKDCYSLDLQKDCQQMHLDENDPDWSQWTFWNMSCVTFDTYCTAHGYSGAKGNDCYTGSKEVKVDAVIGEFGVSPAEDYFNGQVLGFTKEGGSRHSWDDYGTLKWQPTLALLLVWTVQILILFKGLKIYGKVAYFITLSPYFMLTAFMVYGSTLDGASTGIDYLLEPDWDKLWKIDVWYNAASQILLSLSLGMGTQIALSSFNQFKNNVMRDAILIGVLNSCTSIFAGFVVFSIIGFLAKQTNSDVSQVVQDGINLAFVSYPSAMVKMDVPQLWSFLFFFMLINLAISSGCAGVHTLATFIMDEWPACRPYRARVILGIALVLLLLGLSLCCNGGILLFTLFDRRCSSSLLFILWIEIAVVTWIYGVDRFIDNIQEMGMRFGLNRPHGILRWFLRLLLAVATPGILIVTVVVAWIERENLSYDGKDFPSFAEGIGWLLELGPLAFAIVVPFWKMYRMRKDQGLGASEVFRNLFLTSEKWSSPDDQKPEKQGLDHLGFDDSGESEKASIRY